METSQQLQQELSQFENTCTLSVGFTPYLAKKRDQMQKQLNKKIAWEEKQARKLERYQDLAKKNAEASVSSWKASDRAVEGIPFGQPILVGHHSENAHRRALKRCWDAMDRSVKEKEKAEYYENKVDNILNSNVISSDNPDAIDLLTEKLANLEAKREKIKAFNKEARKNKTEQVPSYSLTNLGQNIASVKKRIEHLKKLAQVEEKEWTFGDNRVKLDPDENRVKVFFPGKPSEEIRTNLKRNGFRWSPYNGCWQRQISRWALDIAKEIAGGTKCQA
jgi:hypothetical protein